MTAAIAALCAHEQCEHPRHARGLCDRHWEACLEAPCRQRVEVEGHPLDEGAP